MLNLINSYEITILKNGKMMNRHMSRLQEKLNQINDIFVNWDLYIDEFGKEELKEQIAGYKKDIEHKLGRFKDSGYIDCKVDAVKLEIVKSDPFEGFTLIAEKENMKVFKKGKRGTAVYVAYGQHTPIKYPLATVADFA